MANYFLQAMLHKEVCNAGFCFGKEQAFAETWEVLDTFPAIATPKGKQAENWYPCTAADIMEQGFLEEQAHVFHNVPPFIYAELCRIKDTANVYLYALDTSYRLWLL